MAAQRIYALFQTVADAERAIGALADRGVPRDQIGVAARQAAEADEAGRVRTGFTRVTDGQDVRQGEPTAAYESQPGTLPPPALAGTVVPMSAVDTPQNVEAVGKGGITTTTPEDAAAGAAVGAGVGLIAGLAAAAAALFVPGVGPILAGGMLASALGVAAGTTAAGATVGGVVGYLRDMGMPEHAASHFADRISEGDYLVTAIIDSDGYDDIKQLLLKYNAAGVDMDQTTAGAGVAQAVARDPALATEIQQPVPVPMTAAEAIRAGELAPPPVGDPLPSRTHTHIVTELPDGTPLVPAQVVETQENMP